MNRLANCHCNGAPRSSLNCSDGIVLFRTGRTSRLSLPQKNSPTERGICRFAMISRPAGSVAYTIVGKSEGVSRVVRRSSGWPLEQITGFTIRYACATHSLRGIRWKLGGKDSQR